MARLSMKMPRRQDRQSFAGIHKRLVFLRANFALAF
jgi:hypothetical protein